MIKDGTLTILSQPGRGTITLQPDDQFRWIAQKIVWHAYRHIAMALRLTAPGVRQIRRHDLNKNSRLLDSLKSRLLERMTSRGIDEPECRLKELAGSCLLDEGWSDDPNELALRIADMKCVSAEVCRYEIGGEAI